MRANEIGKDFFFTIVSDKILCNVMTRAKNTRVNPTVMLVEDVSRVKTDVLREKC